MVVSTCHGSTGASCLRRPPCIGERAASLADAYTRDTLGLIELGFPTITAGIHCTDSLGRLNQIIR